MAYDTLKLLKTERYDSKPNMGQFLKQHVTSIRLAIANGKVELWPNIGYKTTKAFVKFNDGCELIKDYSPAQNYPRFYLFNNLDEIEINASFECVIDKFFSYLEGFKFIRTNQQSIE